jgi:YesN/AraC family two-component response regulator
MTRQFPYDIVFMDCYMPVMDGFESTAEIRRLEGEERHTIIIALTANAIKGYREICLAAGMDDYLSKPIRSRELKEKLERWMPHDQSCARREKKPAKNPDGKAQTEEVFDQDRLQELLAMFRKVGKDFFPAVVEPFLKNVKESIPLLQEAIEQGRSPGFRETAHRLKGGSTNLGMQKISKICSTLLENVHLERPDDVLEIVRFLEAEMLLTQELVQAMRKNGLI